MVIIRLQKDIDTKLDEIDQLKKRETSSKEVSLQSNDFSLKDENTQKAMEYYSTNREIQVLNYDNITRIAELEVQLEEYKEQNRNQEETYEQLQAQILELANINAVNFGQLTKENDMLIQRNKVLQEYGSTDIEQAELSKIEAQNQSILTNDHSLKQELDLNEWLTPNT